MLVAPVHCNLCLSQMLQEGVPLRLMSGFSLISSRTSNPDVKWDTTLDPREARVHICTDCVKAIVALDKQGAFEVP